MDLFSSASKGRNRTSGVRIGDICKQTLVWNKKEFSMDEVCLMTKWAASDRLMISLSLTVFKLSMHSYLWGSYRRDLNFTAIFGLRFWSFFAAAKSLQSYPTLYDPIDSSPPGSHIPGILQARTLEWVAISFSFSSEVSLGTLFLLIGITSYTIFTFKNLSYPLRQR